MNKSRIDKPLTISVALMLITGMVMVFSASSMVADSRFGSLTFFLQKQMVWSALSIGLMILFSSIDYRKYKQHGLPTITMAAALVLLIGLYPLGLKINGARRWYDLGLMNFQVSELAKMALILYFAWYLSTPGKNIRDLKTGLLPLIAVLGLTVSLVVFQPDLSTALMLVMISGSMLLISRVRWLHLFGFGLALVPAVILFLNRGGYQMGRLNSWLAGLDNPENAGGQVFQSLIGLGRGGWFGHSIGQSKQKFFFLPDSHTDFIFSIIGEEFGFIGTTIVLLGFMFILYRGLYIARRVPDTFGKFLAIGITLNIVLYALVNAAVVSMLLPATGLPMPFISYGGSHLLFLGVATGILLNISKHTQSLKPNWQNFREQRERLYNTVITEV